MSHTLSYRSLVTLMLIIVVGLITPTVTGLTCATLLGGTTPVYVDLTSLRNCLRALPVNKTFNSEVAETAILGAQMHSFSTFVPTAYSNVLNLRNQVDLNEFDFLTAASKAYASAQDLHFTMRGPPFYDKVYIIRVLGFNSRLVVDPVTNVTSQQLYVSSVLNSNYAAALSAWQASGTTATFPTQSSIVATGLKNVSTINGMAAMDWARRVARAAGLKSDSANLNSALQTGFFSRILNEVDVERDTDTIVFTDGTTFTAPAIAYIGTSFAKSYRCDLGATTQGPVHARRQGDAPEPTMPTLIGMGRIGGEDTEMREVVDMVLTPIADALQSQNSARVVSSTSVGSVTGFGSASIETTASGKSVALLRINSFYPSGDLSTVANNAVNMVQQLGAASVGVTTELAIDVSQNGGGYVVLGDLMLKALDTAFNEAFISNGKGGFQILNANNKNSMWTQSYIRNSVLSGPFKQYWYSALNESYIYDLTSPKPRYTYPPTTTPWWVRTSGSSDYFTPMFQFFLGTSLSATVTNPFKRIRILSDGVCGSTCCQFATRLSKWGATTATVELVGFGGFYGDSFMPVADFCGGTVTTVSCALSTANLKVHPTMTLPTLRGDIDFGFADLIVFNTNTSTVPMQYDTAATVTQQFYDWSALTSQQRRLDLAYAGSSAVAPHGVAVVVGCTVALWLTSML